MYNKSEAPFPKMLSLVLIFLSILLFIPNITIFRIVQIGNFQESLAIFFFPFVYSIADSITEKYGQKRALFILLSCYLISLFFSVILMLSCYLPFPSNFDNQDAYVALFKRGPYVILVGLLSVSLSMLANIRLMSKLKLKMRNKHFIIRSIISASIGELIVTGLAYPLLFMSIDTKVIALMINAYLFKVVYSIVAAFPARFLVFLMRYIDGDERSEFNKDFQYASQSVKEVDSLAVASRS